MLVRGKHAYGSFMAWPVNDRISRAIARDMRKNGAGDDADGSALMSVEDAEYVFGEKFRALEDGYAVRIDGWEYRHVCGYCAD